MTKESLQERVEALVAVLQERVKVAYHDDLQEWTDDLNLVLERVDTIAYSVPVVQSLEAYVNDSVVNLPTINDRIVCDTLKNLICRLSRLLKRRNESTIRAFLKIDISKTINRNSPYLYRGHRCQVTQNNHSKTVRLTLDNSADDAKEVLAKISNIMLN